MNSIRERLTRFIRQYYLNKILRGAIILGIAFIILLMVFAGIEFLGWLNSATRGFLFYSFLIFNAVILTLYVIVPLTRLTGIAGGISMNYAARIIGRHFPQIEDKLLNLLQLQELGTREDDHTTGGGDLLNAAIQQKEILLRPFPFVKAVEFKGTLSYLRLLAPAVLIFLAILGFRPEFLKDPVHRISHYSLHFEKPAPFTFEVINEKLTGISKSSFSLKFTTSGEAIPDEAFVEINGINYKAQKSKQNLFELEIPNLQTDVIFRMNSLDYYSKPYTLKVIPRPGIRNFKIQLEYPAYTKRQNEVVDNIGDLIVPRGTNITWRFNTYHADDLKLLINEEETRWTSVSKESYSISRRVLNEMSYSVKPVNKYIDTLGMVSFSIEVIPDEYPVIKVDEIFDSLNHFMIFFSGEIADDYGFTRLQYNYAQVRGEDTVRKQQVPIQIPINDLRQRFMHYDDLQSKGFAPGDKLVWFFEVWDNDRVSGPKTSRSYQAVYRIPGFAELDELQDQIEKDIKDKLETTIKSARAIQRQAKELNDELRHKEQLNWQDKEKINQLLNRQQQMKSNIEELQKMMDYKFQKENQFKQIDEDLLEKQKLLQELMDKLLDDETRKLLEEIQKLMEELDKDKVDEMLQKINLSNDEINRELERNLEIFKQLELEKDLRESIEELNKLTQDQKELAEETEKQGENKQEKISEKQEELNDKFDQISDKLDKIQKNNKELEFPNQIENTDQDRKSIKQDMQESLDQINQGRPRNASGRQQNAAQKMQKLSDKLSDMYDDMMEEQIAEDIMTLRQILKNLIQLSFDQEELMKNTQRISRQDPKYPEAINRQNILKRDFQVIEDSLVALGKRQTAIQSIVSKEISAIKDNMDQAISNFLDVHTVGIVNRAGKDKGIERQQFAMTSMNNLALLLAEALDNMKDQQNQMKAGMGKQCKKPSSGLSMGQIKQRQQSLNQQLQKLRDQMQQGNQQQGRNTMSEQFARMAAEQEAIRRALGEYMQELQKQGLKDKGNLSDLMQQMEKTEEELVNKIINSNTLRRQEEIKTRLLESEHAEREREFEERRESKEVKNQIYSNPSLFLEYKRLTEKEQEMLRYSTPLLHLFYKNKVNDFMIKQEAM